MIENTFCHISGIGEKTEARLWDLGILSWQDFFQTPDPPIGRAKTALVQSELAQSVKSLNDGNFDYFSDRLPSCQHWRMFAPFAGRVAYIDIETNGLSRDYDLITTIALYDGRQIRWYVHGQNLDRFPEDISCYDMVVTYNGKSFDIPFIERFFGIRFSGLHIDLRHLLNSLGFKGGLKNCEKQFGIDRYGLDGVDGFFAVLLWNQYAKTHNRSALETLLAYNIEDAVNLEYLMYAVYNLKVQKTPFAQTMALELPQRPFIPFAPDRCLIDSIRQKYLFKGS
jgi:hypothetical protein